MTLWPAIFLSLQLAFFSTVILIVVATPMALWLAYTSSRLKPIFEAIFALPLVLPPTVLGFYLLLIMAPDAPLGQFWVSLTGGQLVFSFAGLLIATVVYSIPFAIQPLQTAFQTLDRRPFEAAKLMGATKWAIFRFLILPLSKRGFLAAMVLSFAHALGEFGVVLMVGGNIPGRTRVIAIEIYNRVETLDYRAAHQLSFGLLLFSFVVLFVSFALQRGALGSSTLSKGRTQ
ncbi:MAG: molybdate ABC transporter permease subunit [Halocynthiibacter sp.]